MTPVRIVLVEDNDSDAELVMTALKREGLSVDWLRADDERSFLSELDSSPESGALDAIITDFNLPSFSALRVLELMRERDSDLPVLVVTGALNDELAAECIKRGAADYLLKDRLARLRGALEGALERRSAARQKKEADRRLLSAAVSRAVLNDMLLASLSVDLSPGSLRSVIEPLFLHEALPGLAGVRVEALALAVFQVNREACADPRPLVERVIDLVEGSGVVGRIFFSFYETAASLDAETAQFLDEAAYVVSGVLKRARAELSLRTSLAEGEELLREIHHRVKNNLAAMQSLVSIEASHIEDGPGRQALESLEGQIRSMSLVHEMLYSRGGFTGIDFDDFLRELKIRIADGAGCPQSALVLEADCGGFSIPLESAVTLGILFNELFNHAVLRSGSSGIVTIGVAAIPAGEKSWRVEYVERSREPSMADGKGLEFVEMLLPQYKGTISSVDAELRIALLVAGERLPQACL